MLVQLYGAEVIRPNHHYATHTADFVHDFGPLREFWTFLFERLNKILKSYKTSNHGGGEIEMTFFREFHRASHMHRLVSLFRCSPRARHSDMPFSSQRVFSIQRMPHSTRHAGSC